MEKITFWHTGNEGVKKLTDVGGEEYLEEWCHKVVDTLYISARRVSDCPYIENTFQAL